MKQFQTNKINRKVEVHWLIYCRIPQLSSTPSSSSSRHSLLLLPLTYQRHPSASWPPSSMKRISPSWFPAHMVSLGLFAFLPQSTPVCLPSQSLFVLTQIQSLNQSPITQLMTLDCTTLSPSCKSMPTVLCWRAWTLPSTHMFRICNYSLL